MNKRDVLILFSSFLVQSLLGFFLGHYNDARVFMATGYSVSSGLNPYEQHDLGYVFRNPLFHGTIPGIGYPPPWPLILGFVYLLSFNIVPDLFLYNFAMKIPVIVFNIGLAYVVRLVAIRLNVDRKKVQYTWLFILFNPFLLLTTSAWGQFDTAVAFLSLVSLYFLYNNNINGAALLLAISLSMKPITLPLIPLQLIYCVKKSPKQIPQYFLVFLSTLGITSILPFYLLGWSTSPILNNWNAQFEVAGGMSPLNIIELFGNSQFIPDAINFIGFLWVPALVIGCYIAYRSSFPSMEDLLKKAMGLILIFFLTRAWLSEPNLNVVLPLVLLMSQKGKISSWSLHLSWIIPMIFMFLNTSLPQLFFLVYPNVIKSLEEFDLQFRTIRLIARFLIVIPWQVLGWKMTKKAFRDKQNPHFQ